MTPAYNSDVMHPSRWPLALLPLVLMAACAGARSDSDDAAESAQTRAVKKGGEFLRCWAESDGTANPFFRNYAVKCRHTASSIAALRGKSWVSVEAYGAGGDRLERPADAPRPSDQPGAAVVVTVAQTNKFPVALRVQGQWGVSEGTTTPFRTTIAVEERTTAEAPARVMLPFDFWPITFLNRLPAAVVSTEAYEVDAAPFVTEERLDGTRTSFLAQHETDLLREPRVDIDFIAPKQGALKVRVQGPPTATGAVIDGPGVYVIEERGLRKATPEDEPDAGPLPPVPVPVRDAGVDATPPTPTPPPTCGNDGQIYCLDAGGARVCNPGARLDVNVCVACGKPGQTYCLDAGGARVCNRGARLEVNSCVACGSNGQTYCLDANGARVCNRGTRLDVNTCVSCGNEGQTYCLAEDGTRTCNGDLQLQGLTCTR